METVDYAIVGAGPAGAVAARALALRGREVVLFDAALREEKACGGGVPAAGMRRFGALVEGVARVEARHARLIGPAGDEAVVPLREPLSIFARRDFDAALRRAAAAAGADWRRARVGRVTPVEDGFLLSTIAAGERRRVRARFVVAADGAAGPIGRALLASIGAAPPRAPHFSSTVTAYPAREGGRSDERGIVLAWLPGIDGYGWSFPRSDHASVGWCELGATGGPSLRARLDSLHLNGAAGTDTVGAAVPSYRGAAIAGTPVEGRRFALAGDAAGAVDPITREGIHHAMATGAALGECDPLAHPGAYGAWFDATLRPELARSARLAPTFFGARFLTVMVRALATSRALQEVLSDLVAGTQRYAKLRARLVRALPSSLPALLRATVRG